LAFAHIMRKVILDAPHFEKFSDFKSFIIKESGLEEELFSKLITPLLTGEQNSPEVSRLYPFLKNYLGEIVK